MPDSEKSTPHPSEAPLERLRRRGPEALSDSELVAVLLRRPHQVAEDLLGELGGLGKVHRADLLARLDSRDENSPLAPLLVAAEISIRQARSRISDGPPLRNPRVLTEYLRRRYERPSQEVMGALYLDTRHRLIHEAEIFRGTQSRTAVEPRVILRIGLLRQASWLVLFHTHPAGDPTPSPEDRNFTERMRDAAEIVGIGLLDHIILGEGERWFSFAKLLRD